MINRIVKRDGQIVDHDPARIVNAILKAATVCGRPDKAFAEKMAAKVEDALVKTYQGDSMPSVEDIQDIVESVLMVEGETTIARSYIIYRHKRAMARSARAVSFEVSDNVPYKKIYEVEHGARLRFGHGP
jgi:anaerobic ribonucleoside-triphosphate reductase